MGNKIITEKDFWTCSEGNIPVQLQGKAKTTKKKSGEKYITIMDKATCEFVDFGCKKYMLLAAILVAATVVVIAAILSTGGAALIAVGAVAGLAGSVVGAVSGALLCGQKMRDAREWSESKKNLIIEGSCAITGGHQMTCEAGGIIKYAPHIKNWSQAISLATANYIGNILEGMMAGAAIGMGGAALWGGARAFAAGGWQGFGRAAWNFAKSIPNNIKVNYIESFRKFGLSIRALMGVQNTTATYGNTGEAGITDFTIGIFAIEIGTYESTYNIITGKGTWHDWTGLCLMISPIGKKLGDLENSLLKEKTKTKVKDSEYTQEGENKTAKTKRLEEEAANSRDGEAYEMYNSIADPIADVLGAGKVSHPKEWQAMIDDLKANGVDIIYRLDEAMAYSPGLNKGKSGQIIINEDASISALIHEYEHFITDKNAGYVGFEGVYDPNFRTQSEIFSYQKEIDFVRENLENNIDLINQLKNNLQKEISDFSKRIGAPDDPTVLQNLENILNN